MPAFASIAQLPQIRLSLAVSPHILEYIGEFLKSFILAVSVILNGELEYFDRPLLIAVVSVGYRPIGLYKHLIGIDSFFHLTAKFVYRHRILVFYSFCVDGLCFFVGCRKYLLLSIAIGIVCEEQNQSYQRCSNNGIHNYYYFVPMAKVHIYRIFFTDDLLLLLLVMMLI